MNLEDISENLMLLCESNSSSSLELMLIGFPTYPEKQKQKKRVLGVPLIFDVGFWKRSKGSSSMIVPWHCNHSFR